MAKDFHFIMKGPYDTYIDDIAQHLWEEQGNQGKPSQFDSLTVRHCIVTRHRALFPEKHQ